MFRTGGDMFKPSSRVGDATFRARFGPGFGKCFPECGIPTRQNVGPKRGPEAWRKARPETRFDPAGSTGRPCRTGAGAPAGAPKRRRKVSKIGPRWRHKVRRTGGANAPGRWPLVAAVDVCGGARSSPGAPRGVRGGAPSDSAAGASERPRRPARSKSIAARRGRGRAAEAGTPSRGVLMPREVRSQARTASAADPFREVQGPL